MKPNDRDERRVHDKAVECTGREGMTQEQAQRAAQRVNFAARPYRCRWCAEWHLWSETKKDGKQNLGGRRMRRRSK